MGLLAYGDTGWGDELFFATLMTIAVAAAAIFIGFLLFRFFDISKLYPVNKVEKIKGSIGVLADDIVAGLMTCIIILLIKQFGII